MTDFQPQPGMRPPAWAARDAMLAAGLVDEHDIARWTAEFERLDRGELEFTLFLPAFTAVASKPA